MLKNRSLAPARKSQIAGSDRALNQGVEASTERVEDSADRRTVLAGDRTVLAAERTYAAWVRTGLVALASGIGAKKLLSGILPEVMIVATGSLLVMFAAFCFVAGVWRDLNLSRGRHGLKLRACRLRY
jgi:inner membrane protein YidH